MKKFIVLLTFLLFNVISLTFAESIYGDNEFYNVVNRDENGFIIYTYETKPELVEIMNNYNSTGNPVMSGMDYSLVIQKELEFKNIAETLGKNWRFKVSEGNSRVESYNYSVLVSPACIGTGIISGIGQDPQKEALDYSIRWAYEEVIFRLSRKLQDIRSEQEE